MPATMPRFQSATRQTVTDLGWTIALDDPALTGSNHEVSRDAHSCCICRRIWLNAQHCGTCSRYPAPPGTPGVCHPGVMQRLVAVVVTTMLQALTHRHPNVATAITTDGGRTALMERALASMCREPPQHSSPVHVSEALL